MESMSCLQDVHARLNLPRPPGPRPKLPAPPRLESAGNAARASVLRSKLLAALGGRSQPLRPAPNVDPVLTLVNRITQGFNVNEYARAQALGYEAYLEEQLDPASIDDTDTDVRIADHFETLVMSPKELYDTYSADFDEPYFQFKGALLLRAVNSKRQLLERMVEFWTDHFNIDHNKGDLEWALMPEHDRTVIRAHALGSFPDMLRACAFGGAMLYYLDNWLNVRGAPQQNYARELLELHTLSVHGGYVQADVDEVAKCFTGWTLNGRPNSPDWLRGEFDPELHTPGPKFVLGHVIGEHHVARPGEPFGSRDAEQVLSILAAHPSTASFLAKKLIRWFLTPTPPEALVAAVANTYLATRGDIKAMLRVILAPENLSFGAGVQQPGADGPVLQPKFRRPFHFMTSLFRTLDAEVRRPPDSLTYLGGMGHVPYDCAPPTGYPDDVEAWGGLLLPRWTFGNLVFRPSFGNGIPGVSLGLSANGLKARLDFQDADDRPGLAERINQRLLGQALSPHEQGLLQEFIDEYPTDFGTPALFDSVSLAVSMPGFQWY